MFFMSSALYPLWRVREGSVLLAELCQYNPFTYVVELVRSTLYLDFNPLALAVVVGTLVVFGALTLIGYTRSEEHPSELQSLMRISYAVFCLKKKKKN